jgi:hypothetical protein
MSPAGDNSARLRDNLDFWITMIEKFEYKGRWKIPGEESWYNGTLQFSPETGSNLEIFGTFNPGLLNRVSKSIILGETNKGDITLVDNYYKTHDTVLSRT